MGVKSLVKQVFSGKKNIEYESELHGHIVTYDEWVSELEKGFASEEVLEGDNEALLVCNPMGAKAASATKWVEEWFQSNPEALVLYGDEDVCGEDGVRCTPYFKPDWSPDLFDSRFYLGGLVAIRKSWLEQCDKELFQDVWNQDAKNCRHQLIRRIVELAGGYERGVGRKTILHIPRILFHAMSMESMEYWMEYEVVQRPKTVEKLQENLLSIVIPSKDNPALLQKCLLGILRTCEDIRYEIVVVDNGSSEENRSEIESVLREIRLQKAPGFTKLLYHHEPMEFNFSKMCNDGARRASGNLLLFLNDDVELVSPGCVSDMVHCAKQPYTGAVGMKLLYPEEKAAGMIQHAGIVNLPMGPVHKLQFCADAVPAYFGRNRGAHNVVGVTAACLMVEKDKFLEVGGFEENLAVAFNDVDLCFKLYEAGYENVCLCDTFAYHDESFSRGDDESVEKLSRLLSEREKLYQMHPAFLEEGKNDPYYSAYLNQVGLDTKIRPGYETSANVLQRENPAKAEEKVVATYRLDPCLLIRVESVLCQEEKRILTGYSVVLGDNNACYERQLLLHCEEHGLYSIPIKGQYRPDLVENMPDQENVGLNGFWIEFDKNALPTGTYQIGVAAKRTVGNMKLVYWSNRMVEV